MFWMLRVLFTSCECEWKRMPVKGFFHSHQWAHQVVVCANWCRESCRRLGPEYNVLARYSRNVTMYCTCLHSTYTYMCTYFVYDSSLLYKSARSSEQRRRVHAETGTLLIYCTDAISYEGSAWRQRWRRRAPTEKNKNSTLSAVLLLRPKTCQRKMQKKAEESLYKYWTERRDTFLQEKKTTGAYYIMCIYAPQRYIEKLTGECVYMHIHMWYSKSTSIRV